jgi:TRAP-type C4-dicarboxylate transport system substrate-binding protein
MRVSKWAICVFCVMLVGFMFFTVPVFGQAKEIKLNYSNFFPAPHKNSVLADEWAQEIGKRTNGRVKITLFHGGTLTPADKVYDGVVKGISDIGMSVLSYTLGRFPLTEVIDLPMGYKNGTAATKLINDYYNKFQPKELSDVKVMYLHAHGPGILHTNKKPVKTLDELKGVKIRSTGTVAKIVGALGGTPVAMPMSETYDALSKGIAEGVMCPVEALQGWKLGEVVKYTTQNYGSAYSIGFFIVMNKNKWKSLPPDVQKIIEAVNQEFIVKQCRVWDEIDASGMEFAKKMGDQFVPLSSEEDQKWAKAVQPVFDDYVKVMKEKGLPGEEALKFCKEELQKLQY